MIEVSFTMLLQWINFGILLFFLSKVLYKPLLNILDKRKAMVESDLDEARKRKEEAQGILREYEDRLADLKTEGRKVIEDSRKQAVLERDRILDEASAEAKLTLDNAKLEIDSYVRTVKEEIKNQTAELVVSCASKVIERELKEEDHQKFIDDFVTRVRS